MNKNAVFDLGILSKSVNEYIFKVKRCKQNNSCVYSTLRGEV